MKQAQKIITRFQLLEDTEDRWAQIFDVLERLAAETQEKVEQNKENK